jgi:hypothetical protein
MPVIIAEKPEAKGIGSICVNPESTCAETKMIDIDATVNSKKLKGWMLGSTTRFTSRSIRILLMNRGIITALTTNDIKGIRSM